MKGADKVENPKVYGTGSADGAIEGINVRSLSHDDYMKTMDAAYTYALSLQRSTDSILIKGSGVQRFKEDVEEFESAFFTEISEAERMDAVAKSQREDGSVFLPKQ